MPAAVMLQGAGSNVGKSVLAAGLCRHFANAGLRVRPFKPQNMSNNAAVTDDGGEIGRAQALQAMACRTPAVSDMNPVLLKPESETGAQLVVRGRRRASMRAAEYTRCKAGLLDDVIASYRCIAGEADLVIAEGAGSPAETNLRKGDIANMGFAVAAEVPVVMVGDIDRGGVIASLVGTHTVLGDADRRMIRGFMVNKFRGDSALFADGMADISSATGWTGIGIMPWFAPARHLPAEDILDIGQRESNGSARSGGEGIRIAVPVFPRIANFDDLDPLSGEQDVALTLVREGEAMPGDADLVLLPGSKSTIADMAFLKEQGWDIDMRAHVRRGGLVMGLCGGYQMLGRRISDPAGVEGRPGEAEGLGLLDVETVLEGTKTLARVEARSLAFDADAEGYEIHMGRTQGADCERAVFEVEGRRDGASSQDGRIAGTYLHGIFAGNGFRRAFLEDLARRRDRGGAFAELDFGAKVDGVLDELAASLAENLDLDEFAAIAGI